MADATVTMNEGALKNLLKTPEGPTGRYIDRKARDVLIQALVNAGGGGPGPQIRGGDLLRFTTYLGIRNEGGEMSAVIESAAFHRGANYPQIQEFGNERQRAYPFLNPAFVTIFGAPVAP